MVLRGEAGIANDQTTDTGLPGWQSFAGVDHMFDQLRDIRDFRLYTKIPPVMELGDASSLRSASAKFYETIATVVQLAGFHSLDELELEIGDDKSVRLNYNDDRFDFSIVVTETAILLRRRGSRFESFHDWYIRIGPHMWQLVSGICGTLSEVTQRPVTIQRAYYSFDFRLLEFRHLQANRPAQNYEIMRNLVQGLPDDSGRLDDSDEVFRTAGRIDVTFSRWITDGVRRWVERYDVQAPANRGGEFLDFAFAFQGETYADPDSNDRHAFEPQEFFERYDTPYGQFLRRRVIQAFLKTLLRDYSFRSAGRD